MHDSLSLDGLTLPIERPTTPAEVGQIVRRAADAGQAVYPIGGRTMLDVGRPPSRPGIAIDLKGLNRVVDYPFNDLTVTVEAGMTMARLQELLKAKGQMLPVDVPDPARATIGGAVASSASGPRRYAFGTLRDHLIGFSAINDLGEEFKAGGRVVKNVAGYDLMKLYTGSFGTLGIITQVTLKLKPLLEARALVTAGLSHDQLAPALDALHASSTRPIAVDITHTVRPKRRVTEEPLPPWSLVVLYEDNPDSVLWQAEKLRDELAAIGVQPARILDGESAPPTLSLVDLPIDPGAAVIFEAHVRPSQVADLGRYLAEILPDGWLQAHAGCGVARIGLPLTVSQESAVEVAGKLLERVGATGGNMMVRRAPTAWKASLPIWGRKPADFALQRTVKQALDPRGLFNPGRFIVDAWPQG